MLQPIFLFNNRMLYSDFKDCRISKLGFGAMRLPLLEDGKTIDREEFRRMIALAFEGGVNYFDTAFPYHAGMSEVVLGELLSDWPRDSWMIADKYPGHQLSKRFDPAGTFARQLRRCGVDYFDFYLMHNVCEESLPVYLEPHWGILDFFVGMRNNGKIRHLGFSCHAEPEVLKHFLDDTPYGHEMEFCQIQLNYLDWDLQKAREKVKLLQERDIPVWVMEPVRGGRLAKEEQMPRDLVARMKALRPNESTAAWAFRWLQSVPGVKVVLSGMSDVAQMADNLKTFADERPLDETEKALLSELASRLHGTVPCTACRYCCDECPMGLDIPTFIQCYNDLSLEFNFTPIMRVESLEPDRQPSQCQSCGACKRICPQGIDIPSAIAGLNSLLAKMPSWADICRQREADAEKNEK